MPECDLYGVRKLLKVVAVDFTRTPLDDYPILFLCMAGARFGAAVSVVGGDCDDGDGDGDGNDDNDDDNDNNNVIT